MQVSSYLEGFLTVYGWMMYRTIFDVLAMSYVLFLPFLFWSYNLVYRSFTMPEMAFPSFRNAVIDFLIMLVVMFLTVVPVDKVDLTKTEYKSVCKTQKMSDLYDKSVNTFAFDTGMHGRVPPLPSLFMRLGQGINNVVYEEIPCTTKVMAVASAYENANFNNEELKNELTRFSAQCIAPAREKMKEIERFTSGPSSPNIVKQVLDESIKNSSSPDAGLTIDEAEFSYGSAMMQLIWRGGVNVYGGKTLTPEQIEKHGIKKMWSKGSEPHVSSIADPEATAEQIAKGEGRVLCSAWWSDLKPRAKEEMKYSFASKIVKNDWASYKESGCKPNYKTTGVGSIKYGTRDIVRIMDKSAIDSCIKAIVENNGADKAKFENRLFVHGQRKYEGLLALSNQEVDNIGLGASAMIVAGVASTFLGGGEVIGGIVSNALSFYTEMFMYRIVSKLIQPMVLMGIFMFWAVFALIARFQWREILQGLTMITVISLFPSIWAVAEHLDNSIYQSMYPSMNLAELVEKTDRNRAERIVLDMASTVFYILFPLILVYMVGMAGGGSAVGMATGIENSTNKGGRPAKGGVEASSGRAVSETKRARK